MDQTTMQQLIEWIKNASPMLLVAAKQKVTAVIVTDFVWAGILVVAVIGVLSLVQWALAKDGDGDYLRGDTTDHDLILVFSSLAIAACFIIAMICLIEALNYLLAPDWAMVNVLTSFGKSLIK